MNTQRNLTARRPCVPARPALHGRVPEQLGALLLCRGLCVRQVAAVVSDCVRPHGLYPARPFCLWDSPGKDTGVGCPALLWRVFPTQGSNLCLLGPPSVALEPPGKPRLVGNVCPNRLTYALLIKVREIM